MAVGHMDKQQLLQQIESVLKSSDEECNKLEQILRTAKGEYKTQKIEIENQFQMISNMLQATVQQLLNQLEQRHTAQNQELHKAISKLHQFSKQSRAESEDVNKDNITQIIDIHERVNHEHKQLTSDKHRYVHKDIRVVLDTSAIMTCIQKMGYITVKTKEEMEQEAKQKFSFHQQNSGAFVRPKIIALNTNSMNTKICVSWKLQPVPNYVTDGGDGGGGVNGAVTNGKDASKGAENGDGGDDDDDDDDEQKRQTEETPSLSAATISMTEHDESSNVAMDVHDIVSIDIEWRYSDQKDNEDGEQQSEITPMEEQLEPEEEENGKSPKMRRVATLDRHQWNVLDVDHHKILAFNLDSSIFDHILNTMRYGVYFFRITLYNRNTKISSREMKITTFKIHVRHIADEWHSERMQKHVRKSFFSSKVVTRDIPGKFCHAFGTLVTSKGVCVWTLRIKKVDSNRQKASAMIGLINMNNRKNDANLKNLNQCFAHIGIGYGLYCTNGDTYHTKTPRKYGAEIKEDDVIQIMCDYRNQTISFVVNKRNWGTAFDVRDFPNGKMPNMGLAIALKGCDEIQLVDFVNEAQTLFGGEKRRRTSLTSLTSLSSSTSKRKSSKRKGVLLDTDGDEPENITLPTIHVLDEEDDDDDK
mmetsp:Transcript_33666/g.54794  ORF Transcript_33666/g.54794 Transcript_33666/m.54794 type:complete len:644 (+) Transcript_33666:62-1993(+)|eukprot:CAMPEP_0202691814 /NCGR_PEP_ID=MMETSP1385-20130828/6417_1 /ASSEMBLY_ACC=CAM_ASM_000861 /TAXON_ID=933848 /ORGANISM="Elphidium margaritaceum" /LENGTH=643 /DNA_ID=CAMNT_0049347267 /DNA_START=24 /DNA_END=1955 /DNA_ORIENTATION=+